MTSAATVTVSAQDLRPRDRIGRRAVVVQTLVRDGSVLVTFRTPGNRAGLNIVRYDINENVEVTR